MFTISPIVVKFLHPNWLFYIDTISVVIEKEKTSRYDNYGLATKLT